MQGLGRGVPNINTPTGRGEARFSSVLNGAQNLTGGNSGLKSMASLT